MFEIGRVCMKTKGHDAGRCVVLDVEKGRALITGPKSLTGVRRRKVALSHLHPLAEKFDIKKDASDAEVAAAMGVSLPAPRVKAAKPQAEKPKAFQLFGKKEESKAEPKAEKPKSEAKPAKKEAKHPAKAAAKHAKAKK